MSHRLTATQLELPEGERLDALIARAERDDLSALPELRAILDSQPELWQAVGNLVEQARDAQIELIARGNEQIRRQILEKIDVTHPVLSARYPTAIESLLMQQVVVANLQSAYRCGRLVDLDDLLPRQASARFRQAEESRRRCCSAAQRFWVVQRLLHRHDEIEDSHWKQCQEPCGLKGFTISSRLAAPPISINDEHLLVNDRSVERRSVDQAGILLTACERMGG